MMAMRRLLPPSLFLLLCLLMVGAAFAFPGRSPSTPLLALGAAGLAFGLALSVSGSRLFDKIGTNIVTFEDPGTLVVSGPFRWSRNPMYLGFQIAITGVAVMLASPWALLGPAAFFVACHRVYIPFEEARLRARFGADYERYRGRVRRWIGRRRVVEADHPL